MPPQSFVNSGRARAAALKSIKKTMSHTPNTRHRRRRTVIVQRRPRGTLAWDWNLRIAVSPVLARSKARFHGLDYGRDFSIQGRVRGPRELRGTATKVGPAALAAKVPPNTRLVRKLPRDLLNSVLAALNLKQDREGHARTFYSLRHTYICMRLLDGAHAYELAKNCRNSVEMIEQHYAVHLRNYIDASLINVRKKRHRRSEEAED